MDEDMTCPICKHGMYQQHMQILGVCGYFDWWECDWCGYATEDSGRRTKQRKRTQHLI